MDVRRDKNFGRYVTPQSVLNVVRSYLKKTRGLALFFPVEGDDISKWNGNINFEVMCALTSFIYIRAGYGINRDLRFEE